MRHRNAGYKLGRNTSHRRALLRNLVTSIILEDRVETTITKAKAARPHVEKLITLGKKGDLHRGVRLLLFSDPRSGHPAVRYRCASLRRSQRRLSPHHPHWLPDAETARKRPSSSCWTPRRFWTRSARSAPKPAPSAAKRCRSSLRSNSRRAASRPSLQEALGRSAP